MKIAIIAGSGNLPVQIATQNKEAFVLCIKDYSCPNSFQNASKIVVIPVQCALATIVPCFF